MTFGIKVPKDNSFVDLYMKTVNEKLDMGKMLFLANGSRIHTWDSTHCDYYIVDIKYRFEQSFFLYLSIIPAVGALGAFLFSAWTFAYVMIFIALSIIIVPRLIISNSVIYWIAKKGIMKKGYDSLFEYVSPEKMLDEVMHVTK